MFSFFHKTYENNSSNHENETRAEWGREREIIACGLFEFLFDIINLINFEVIFCREILVEHVASDQKESGGEN